jgi:hypothetical protein
MNLCEITLHGTASMYLLASTKYRALELSRDYLADAGRTDMRPRPLARGRMCAIPERSNLSRKNPCRDRTNVLELLQAGSKFSS